MSRGAWLRVASLRIALFAILVAVSSPAFAQTQDLHLAWDPVDDADIDHYNVYIGTAPGAHDVVVQRVAATQQTSVFAATPGVLYYFAVSATNTAGLEGPLSDEISGSVPTLFQPGNRTSTIGVPIVPLQLFASDPDGGTLQFSHTGLPIGLLLDSSTGLITGVPTVLGAFNVEIIVSDGVLRNSQSFVWTIQSEGAADITAPTLTISNYSDGQSVPSANISLTGTASDSGRGDSGIAHVWVNGALASGGTASGSGTANWSRTLTLPSASNTILVEAQDGAGNYTATMLTLTRDVVAPMVAITSHTPGQVVNTSSITLSGTATDQGSGGNGVASLTVNGTAAAGGTASGNGVANWSRTLSLSSGSNVLSISASDTAGNVRTTQITIVRDSTAPSISITSHSSGQTVTSGTITLSGTATDNGAGGNGVTGVAVNGATASGGTASGNGSASWNRTVTLSVGTNTLTVTAADGAGNVRTATITLTFTPPAVLTADSVSPTSGSGASQMFALQYSSNLGATNVSTGWVWFTSTFSSNSANSCMLYYNRGTSTLFMLNDGQTWMSGAIGSSATLQNSQCAVSLSASSATTSGNSLIVNLAMTFSAAYSGAKQVYTYAQNPGGANSGWQHRGDWTIPSLGNATVTADAVTPGGGSGSSQTFAFQFSDTLGASDLSTAWVWFNATFASVSTNSCMLYYDRGRDRIFLLNDGQSWMQGTMGNGGTLQNSQCALSLSGSSVMLSGNTLTLNLAMTFASSYAGGKHVYTFAQNANGVNSGWQQRGDWTVPGSGSAPLPATPVITADAVTPSAGSGAVQTFSVQYSDTLGATDLSTLWVWFNATFAATSNNSCMLYYDRAMSRLNLANDAGTTWMAGTLGSSTTLQNSQCAVSLAGSSASTSGNTITLNLAMTFKTAFAGAKHLYTYAANATNVNSDWQYRGDWTVPGVGSAIITADSATPQSGYGSTQTFSLQYSDNLGATDISKAWVWFNATFATTSANSCMLYYNRPTNQLFLLNDSGTTWMRGTVGNFGSLQNSQCTVSLRNSSATLNGNALTVNLAMTFRSAYAGAKHVFMYGHNANNVNSGWQDRGDWTVP